MSRNVISGVFTVVVLSEVILSSAHFAERRTYVFPLCAEAFLRTAHSPLVEERPFRAAWRWRVNGALAPAHGSSPNTATPFGVPTYTFPFAIVGVINLFPPPK